jgi:Peptidase M50B-like
MTRRYQFLFSASVLALCWFGMQAVHELGHVLAAWLTGGSVNRVVLHPLSISRTDVAPNPHPLIVVWAGPLVGAILPLALAAAVRRPALVNSLAAFFAGFCLIANGAYIALGSFDRVGDCGEMLRNGTPAWALHVFGVVTIPVGFWLWHRLGPPRSYLRNPSLASRKMAFVAAGLLVALVGFLSVASSR